MGCFGFIIDPFGFGFIFNIGLFVLFIVFNFIWFFNFILILNSTCRPIVRSHSSHPNWCSVARTYRWKCPLLV